MFENCHFEPTCAEGMSTNESPTAFTEDDSNFAAVKIRDKHSQKTTNLKQDKIVKNVSKYLDFLGVHVHFPCERTNFTRKRKADFSLNELMLP